MKRCSLMFGSWAYDGFKMDVNFYDEKASIDLKEYVESNGWNIIENYAQKNIKYYPCCEEPYPDLTFYLVLQRVVSDVWYLYIRSK